MTTSKFVDLQERTVAGTHRPARRLTMVQSNSILVQMMIDHASDWMLE